MQEARALLGRYEYQKGNIVAALHVFEGIDIGVVTPKIKIALSRSRERRKRHSQNHAEPQMSIHSVGLLLEAVFLKAKSLQVLERFKGTPTGFVIQSLVFFFFFFTSRDLGFCCIFPFQSAPSKSFSASYFP